MKEKLESVRRALHEAGKNLSPADWKALLEELHADITGHLDAVEEESANP